MALLSTLASFFPPLAATPSNWASELTAWVTVTQPGSEVNSLAALGGAPAGIPKMFEQCGHKSKPTVGLKLAQILFKLERNCF